MDNINWDKWTGFEGDGVYVMFNKADSKCLELWPPSSDAGTDIRSFSHLPHNKAQMWKICKHDLYEIYTIENIHEVVLMAAIGEGDIVTGIRKEHPGVEQPPKAFPHKTPFWVVDGGMHALEKGQPVV
ncbi:MAG: hypothetical protein Q9166_008004 [cf. Caloplaca sp. 2 TL-2023]